MTGSRTDAGPRALGWPLVVLTAVFLLSRLILFVQPPPATDVLIYARYAWEYAAAQRQGVSFYDFHAAQIQRQVEQAPQGAGQPNIEEYKDVEYPPLAVAFMRWPALIVGGDAGDAGPSRSYELRYYLAFRLGMVVVDAALFFLTVALVRRWYADAGPGGQVRRLGMYLLLTLVLWHLLYDRLDLLLTALVVLALALLTARVWWGWSFAVLAAAILFKVTPVVLAPLWVVGAMPADRPLAWWRPRALAGLGARAVLLVALVAAGLLPFVLWSGPGCLGFWSYHRARPLEIGSLYSSLALNLGPLAHPVRVGYSYGSVNVYSPLTPALAALSPVLTAAVLLAAMALLLLHFRRLSRRPQAGAGPEGTLAQLHPLLMVQYSLLFLMLAIAAGKVFSTQYLLWLVPLVVLLPPGGGQRLFLWTFFVVCVLSTALVPYLYLSDLIDTTVTPVPPLPLTVQPPTARLVAVLLIRNLLFAGLTAALAVHLLRAARAGSGGARWDCKTLAAPEEPCGR
jgi:hypothetical protein